MQASRAGQCEKNQEEKIKRRLRSHSYHIGIY